MIYFPNIKINIGLNIIEKLPCGYHNIESIFYPVSLEDILEIRPKDSGKTSILVSGLGVDTKSDQDNLCIKAYNLIKKDYPNIPEVNIHLHKQIPIGAGLGGGSSDAVFTLKLINYLFSLNLLDKELEVYAKELGSDCTFFVYNVPAFAFEKGDKLASTTLVLRKKIIVLVKPDIFISTKEAYSQIIAHKPDTDLLNTIESKPISQWRYFVKNDFEEGVFKKYPVLNSIKERLYSLGALYAQMSGSGSTIYGIFDREITQDEIKLFGDAFVCQRVLK